MNLFTRVAHVSAGLTCQSWMCDLQKVCSLVIFMCNTFCIVLVVLFLFVGTSPFCAPASCCGEAGKEGGGLPWACWAKTAGLQEKAVADHWGEQHIRGSRGSLYWHALVWACIRRSYIHTYERILVMNFVIIALEMAFTQNARPIHFCPMGNVKILAESMPLIVHVCVYMTCCVLECEAVQPITWAVVTPPTHYINMVALVIYFKGQGDSYLSRGSWTLHPPYYTHRL